MQGGAKLAQAYATSRAEPMIGDSLAMRRLRTTLDRVAATDATVLILGETGTGKELAARRVHEQSLRRRGRLVAINCAAIPDELVESELFGHVRGAFTGARDSRMGAFEGADGGTLLLDEIGDMSARVQGKVLRAIEGNRFRRVGGQRERNSDVRIVAATNQPLHAMTQTGRFRIDLYYRLKVAEIQMPPLRDRKEDVPELVEMFLADACARLRRPVRLISPRAMELLLHHDWPGNVRELKNLIEGTVAKLEGDVIRAADVSAGLPMALPESCKRAAERDRIVAELIASDWNKTRTAKALGWSRMTLYRKLAKYGIERPEETGGSN